MPPRGSKKDKSAAATTADVDSTTSGGVVAKPFLVEEGGVSDKYLFEIEEKVLVISHKEQWAVANIKKRRLVVDGDDVEYYVKYHGWSAKWSEWVDQSVVLKYTPENVVKKKEVDERRKAKEKAEKEALRQAEKEAERLEQLRRRKRQQRDEHEQNGYRGSKQPRMTVIDVSLTPPLLEHLALDSEMYNHEDRHVCLCHCRGLDTIDASHKHYTITDICNAFQQYKAVSRSEERLTREMLQGIRSYFEHALPIKLLYWNEAEQHRRSVEVLKKASGGDGGVSSVCDIYGFTHLVRLLYKMPTFLGVFQMTGDQTEMLEDRLGQFIRWLTKDNDSRKFRECDVFVENDAAE